MYSNEKRKNATAFFLFYEFVYLAIGDITASHV